MSAALSPRTWSYFCFGMVAGGVMTVRFTHCGGRIRIFGAGHWRKGKRIYEQQKR
jgi:uncharacterized protein